MLGKREETQKKILELINMADDHINSNFDSAKKLKLSMDLLIRLSNYSYYNVMLIQNQFPEVTAVGSFEFWKEHVFSVKRGEKGIPILVPVSRAVEYFIDEDGNRKNIWQATPDEKKLISLGEIRTHKCSKIAYRLGYVFDVTQTTSKIEDITKTFPKRWDDLVAKDEGLFLEAIIAFIEKEGFHVEILENDIDEIKGKVISEDDLIYLSSKNTTLENIKAAIYQFASYRLNKDDSSLSEYERDFQAEIAAYCICSYFYIDTADYTFDYIDEWSVGHGLRDKKHIYREATKLVNEFSYKLPAVYEEIRSNIRNQKSQGRVLSDTLKKENYEKTEKSVQQVMNLGVSVTKKGTRKVKKDTKIIKDFGEKIGGAKKDLWRERGLRKADIEGMNEAEKEKYIKKDNIWKKPDYLKLIEDGMPIHVAFFMKKVRDSIPTKPIYTKYDTTEARKLENQNNYIDMIGDIKEQILKLETDTDICNFFREFTTEGKYLERSSYSVTPTEKGSSITSKMVKAMQENSYTIARYDREIKKKQFGVKAEEKVPKGYEIHYYDGKGYTRDESWKAGTYFIAKGYHIIEVNIESYEAAFSRVKEIAGNNISGRKKKYIPEQLTDIVRSAPDENTENATGNMYIEDFGFRGGEFGHWMNEIDKQASLNYGYDALTDLAYALGIEKSGIAFDGKLAIAFGARGSGNAVAHYEPLRRVINLTKMRGAGSLAHEWAHAFDNIIGKEYGINGYISESRDKNVPESMRKLVDRMKYRDMTEEEKKQQMKKILIVT